MNAWSREMRFSDQPPSYAHLRAVEADNDTEDTFSEGASVRCGWGRVIMGHTFSRPEDVARQLLQEPRRRPCFSTRPTPTGSISTAPWSSRFPTACA